MGKPITDHFRAAEELLLAAEGQAHTTIQSATLVQAAQVHALLANHAVGQQLVQQQAGQPTAQATAERLWLADFDGDEPTLWTSQDAARDWIESQIKTTEDMRHGRYRRWTWQPDGDSLQQIWLDPDSGDPLSDPFGPGRVTPLVPDAKRDGQPAEADAGDAPDELTRLRERVAELEEDAAKLAALRAFGVDNWEGYSDALASLNDED
jgi:hypothetical protein